MNTALPSIAPSAGLCFDTALGPFRVTASEDALLTARFDGPPPDLPANALCREAAAQLCAWLAGRLRAFELPIAPQGTAFQHAVWTRLLAVHYGGTTSYGALAAALERPAAARAVGAAVGRNPLWLIVPCHRVLGAGGALTGYAGGLARKRALLALEAAHAPA